MQKDDIIRLRHMLDACREALSFIADKSRSNLDNNRMLVLSIIKEVEIIGEAANKVSSEVRNKYVNIPWLDIIGMRHHLIHGYFDVDLDVVWDTVTKDIPPLIIEIERILSTENKQVANNILDEIIFYKKESLERQKKQVSLDILKKKISDLKPARDFANAISGKGINIIAEIKKASPSKGIIREDFDPVQIARIYEENSAKAISILTEEKYFLGSIYYLNKIKGVTNLPILRKDFIFDEYQIYEARANGAAAVLLIAGILDKKELNNFLKLSHSLGMTCLVEVHDKVELDKVLSTDAKIIGINNRDLKTFKVDINTTIELIKDIPSDRLVVSESGINTHEDILKLKHAGVKAFLIGEALMREKDIGKKLREMKGSC